MSQKKNDIEPKRLSFDMLNSSPEINTWLSQFSDHEKIIAKTLLIHLEFISRDTYSHWLRKTINNFSSDVVYALFSVRKFDTNTNYSCLWNEGGDVVTRPGKSQGSEDLVYSLISNLVRANPAKLIDHPSLGSIRDHKIHNIVIVDDSIGSGDRVSGFINAMLEHPTFLSWWSLGLIKIHIVAYARPREADNRIVASVHGSDHGKRTFRKSSKISFTSEKVYSINYLQSRWGNKYEDIIRLCDDQKTIKNWARRGYGKVMANLVFYHSVPNNTPGVIWFKDSKWQALLPGRAIPDWLIALLENQAVYNNINRPDSIDVPNEIISILALMKRGVRNTSSLALRLDCDNNFVAMLVDKARESGFITKANRLTSTGIDILKRTQTYTKKPSFNYSLYIPGSWCADQVYIQPPTRSNLSSFEPIREWADSNQNSFCEDGEVG